MKPTFIGVQTNRNQCVEPIHFLKAIKESQPTIMEVKNYPINEIKLILKIFPYSTEP